MSAMGGKVLLSLLVKLRLHSVQHFHEAVALPLTAENRVISFSNVSFHILLNEMNVIFRSIYVDLPILRLQLSEASKEQSQSA